MRSRLVPPTQADTRHPHRLSFSITPQIFIIQAKPHPPADLENTGKVELSLLETRHLCLNTDCKQFNVQWEGLRGAKTYCSSNTATKKTERGPSDILMGARQMYSNHHYTPCILYISQCPYMVHPTSTKNTTVQAKSRSLLLKEDNTTQHYTIYSVATQCSQVDLVQIS